MATERFDGSDAIMKLRVIVDAVREYDREMPAQTMLAMFLIGSHPNITQNELQRMLGVESSTANRIAARLSEYKDGLRKQPGYGFITRRRAPHDQRLVELTLTPKGYGFLRKVSNRLNGGTSDS